VAEAVVYPVVVVPMTRPNGNGRTGGSAWPA
jgi:hypothetical protein